MENILIDKVRIPYLEKRIGRSAPSAPLRREQARVGSLTPEEKREQLVRTMLGKHKGTNLRGSAGRMQAVYPLVVSSIAILQVRRHVLHKLWAEVFWAYLTAMLRPQDLPLKTAVCANRLLHSVLSKNCTRRCLEPMLLGIRH
jgi:hypothetical protein